MQNTFHILAERSFRSVPQSHLWFSIKEIWKFSIFSTKLIIPVYCFFLPLYDGKANIWNSKSFTQWLNEDKRRESMDTESKLVRQKNQDSDRNIFNSASGQQVNKYLDLTTNKYWTVDLILYIFRSSVR